MHQFHVVEWFPLDLLVSQQLSVGCLRLLPKEFNSVEIGPVGDVKHHLDVDVLRLGRKCCLFARV
jgi:hypothetical protein